MASVQNAPSPNDIHGTVLNQTLSPTTTVSPPSLDSGRIIKHVMGTIVSQSAALDQCYPSFLRRHGSTSRHHVVADEVDRDFAVGLAVNIRFHGGEKWPEHSDCHGERKGRRKGGRAE